MGSRLRKRKRNDPPDKWKTEEEHGETMDYRKAEQLNVWEIERKLADDILESLRRNEVDDMFMLDQLTRGKGNCFMVAMMQQLRREEVYERSRPDIKEVAASMNHRIFRVRVYDWVKKHLNHPKINSMREMYELDQAIRRDLGEETRSWNDYWNNMLKDGIWADQCFVQASALFLNMDIWIMDTTCTKKKPYFPVEGNLEDSEFTTDVLYLGLAHESHYQSLLLNDQEDMDVVEEEEKDEEEEEKNEDEDEEKYENEEKTEEDEKNEEEDIEQEESKDEEEWNDEELEYGDEKKGKNKDEVIESNKCPICEKKLKNVLLHIRKSKNCKSKISKAKLDKLEARSKGIRKAKTKKNFEKFKKEKIKKIGNEGVLKSQNASKAKSRKKLQNDKELKDKSRKKLGNDNEIKAKSRKKMRDENYEELQERENEHQANSRKRNKLENEEEVKEKERNRKAMSRKIGNSSKSRLNRFREDIMYGPLFICICCHGKIFRHGVQEFTEKLMKQIGLKIPLHCVIADMNVLTRIVTEYPHNPWSSANKKKKDDIGTRYICSYCVSYLKCGKMPPTCVMNSLQLHDTDASLKKQDLCLTELEASLISINLIFHKIFTLPRSRWTGLTGKVINVPITSEAINQTLVQLPKTPTSAGLISLTFKRMKEMKNSHKKQLINPDKIFRMLHKLRESGSPYHQNLLTPEQFKNECQRRDEQGYQLMYGKDDLEDDMDPNDFGEVIDKIMEDEFKTEMNEDMDKSIENEEIIGILSDKMKKHRKAEKDEND